MVWEKIKRLLTVDDTILNDAFLLTPDEEDQEHQPGKQEGKVEEKSDTSSSRTAVNRAVRRFRHVKTKARVASRTWPRYKEIRPVVYAELQARAHSRTASLESRLRDPTEIRSQPEFLQLSLEDNRATLQGIFHMPTNADVVIRDFQVGGAHPAHAMLVFMDGLADKQIINTHILEPLMLLSSLGRGDQHLDLMSWIQNALLPGNQTTECKRFEDVVSNVLAGSSVLFVDGINTALSVETKGWEHRMVSTTQTESVVRGPHDAFTENFRANTGLVRSRLRSADLVTEILRVGQTTSTDVAIMYLEGVVNPKVVRELKRRVKGVKVDYMPDSGLLEQFLEDGPLSLIPRFLSTERPDRVAYGMSEGQVAILVGQSPYALLAPTLFWSLLHTAEDAYLRWPFGAFIRSIRTVSLIIGLLLPSLYIAVTNFHPEMIPTDLMLAVAASREHVPFSVVIEVAMMEFSIELIREAGIRIPSVIGPTIGIVGALILGQAAVAAGIISPLLIIVVAVTALGSFTVPNYNLSFSVRVLRFGFLILASVFGFYGIVLGIMALLMHAVTLRSVGVPIMAPVAPRRNSAPDAIWRGFAFNMERRPEPYWPKKERRQTDITRPWNKRARQTGGPTRPSEPGGARE